MICEKKLHLSSLFQTINAQKYTIGYLKHNSAVKSALCSTKLKLGTPIDRVPTSKSCTCVLHRNRIPFFQHLTVSWSLPVARTIFLKKCNACIKVFGEESVLRLLRLYEPAI